MQTEEFEETAAPNISGAARTRAALFPSFFLGGFECSTHYNRSGRRLDLVAATGHDRFARQDYERLSSVGIRTAREGLRWHLVEPSPGRYDFTWAASRVRAARKAGVHLVWDLCHYGWPDDVDVFRPAFVRRFAGLARAFVLWLSRETDATPYIAPVNEPSFLAWAGGATCLMPPFARKRGKVLKSQLARAAIAATEAAWEERPDARIFHVDPICNVVPASDDPEERRQAWKYHESQFYVWDMIAGYRSPKLGGRPEYLDVVGVNYYEDNQWVYPNDMFASTTISAGHPGYRPLHRLLRDVHERYNRPLFVAETGTEDDARPGWLRGVCEEVFAARATGIPVEGLCLYPILNHPGWEDDRHCHNGLWDYPDERGHREIYTPLAEELIQQQRRFTTLFESPFHREDANGA